jgi:hypothetical protein
MDMMAGCRIGSRPRFAHSWSRNHDISPARVFDSRSRVRRGADHDGSVEGDHVPHLQSIAIWGAIMKLPRVLQPDDMKRTFIAFTLTLAAEAVVAIGLFFLHF